MIRSNNQSDVQKILRALKRYGPLREADLKAKAGVHSIGEVYEHLRDEHGVGRLHDYRSWPDGNDKLYFLGWAVDPEWSYREMQNGYKNDDAVREELGLQ